MMEKKIFTLALFIVSGLTGFSETGKSIPESSIRLSGSVPLPGCAFSPADMNRQSGTVSAVHPVLPQEFKIEPPHPANTQTVTVADFGAATNLADNTDAFQRAIDFCRETGAAKLVVPPGMYYFMNERDLEFSGMHDFEFDGQGAELIWGRINQQKTMLFLRNCERSVFKNFVMDWDTGKLPVGSYVRVLSADPNGGTFDIEFVDYKEFPQKDVRIYLLTPVTEDHILGYEDSKWVATRADTCEDDLQWLTPNRARITVRPGKYKSVFDPLRTGGLYLASHYRFTQAGLAFSGLSHVSFQDVVVHAVPGIGFLGINNKSHIEFSRCKGIARPGQAMSACNGHFQVENTQGFIRFEDCEFAGGGDDAINIHDNLLPVKYSDTYTLVAEKVKVKHYLPESGDPVELCDGEFQPAGYRSQIVSCTFDTRNRTAILKVQDPLPADIPDQAVLVNRRFGTENIIVRNCYFHDIWARGVLVQGNKWLVENCRFERTQLAGMLLTSGIDPRWAEGMPGENITVRSNVFTDCNTMNRGYYDFDWPLGERAAVIYVRTYPDICPRTVFQNIVFENNRFINTPGSAFFISSAKNLAVTQNQIANPTARKRNWPIRGSIEVVKSDSISVQSNSWQQSPYVKAPGIFYDTNSVSNIMFHENRID